MCFHDTISLSVICLDDGRGGAGGLLTKGFVEGFQGNELCSDAATQMNSLEMIHRSAE